MSSNSQQFPAASAGPDPRRWWALFLLCAAQFIVILDTSIIAIALPDMQRGLDISAPDLQWVFNAYVVAFGGLLLLGGRLSDLFGQRRLFMTGFAILTVSALVAGLAPSPEMLFAGRALMGVGAALIAPASLSLVMSLFGGNPRELGKAFAFFGASAPAGGTAGVFLGGVITEWLTWRWTLLINVPLGLVVLALSLPLLRAGVVRKGRIDIAGALAVTAALTVGVYTIVTAADFGWATPRTVGLLGLALGLLAAFIVIQAVRKEPLVSLRIFTAPNLSAGNSAMALLGAAWIPMWFFLNLYLQQVLGYSAFLSGLALLPMTLAIMVLMVCATGRLIALFGFKANIIVGFALIGVSLLLFAQAPTDGNFLINVLPASLLAAAGMSAAYIPIMMVSTSGAATDEQGLASGLVNTTYQVGSALGLAVMTSVAASFSSGDGVSGLNDGFRAAFFGAAGVAALGALAATIWLRERRPAAQPETELAAEFAVGGK
ncbi:MAG: MFS transporter [Dehalococcoidia bacterium]|nr:MFS transporter [Dehalococcoidia bacterium]